MSEPDRGALDHLKIDRSSARRRRTFPWGPVLGLALLAGAGVWWGLRPKPPEVKTAVVRAQAAPVAGETQTLLNASGYVTARRAATVSAKVTGKVTEVLVEEGMNVSAGQIVARIDDSNAKASLALAEARLEAARGLLDETRPTLIFAQQELKRFMELRSSNATSLSDLARAESEVAALKARQIRQEADIRVAQRSIDEWKQQVDDTIIRAPFAGIVTTKDAQPGEIISPMSAGGGFTRTGICTVVDMGSLEIEVDVNESYLIRVQPNQPAEATLDAYADWRIPCRVTAIIPTADRQKATVKVRVAFEKLDPRILPDMGVKVAFQNTVPAPSDKEAAGSASRPAPGVTVPQAAVTGISGDGGIVWVLRDDKVERRAVRLGRTSAGETAVAAGLNPGEKVILNPPDTLADGASVREAKP